MDNLSNISPDKLHALKCRASFHYFVQWCWTLTKPNSEFIDSPYVKFLCDHLQLRMENIRDGIPREGLLLSIAPATGKSFILSLCAPVYMWLLKPDASIICCSVNTSLALGFSTESRSLLMHPHFQKFFPFELADDTNAKNEYKNLQGGRRISFGLETPSIGKHAILHIVDDPQSPALVSSEPDRTRINTFLSQHLPSRTGNNPAHQRWLVMQRLSKQDAIAYIEPYGLDEVICLPAELNEKCTNPELYIDGLLAPELLSEKRLNALRISLGMNAYQAQINQNPFNNANALITPEMFGLVDELPAKHSRLYVFFDGALSAKKSADYSAAIACFTANNNLYITDVFRRKLEFHELTEQLTEWIKTRNGFDRTTNVFLEPKASGLPVYSFLKNNSSLNVFTSPAPKVSKEERMQGIAARIAAGRVKLLRASWNSDLITEACGLGKNDDLADTLEMAVTETLKESRQFDYTSRVSFPGTNRGQIATKIFRDGWRTE